MFSNHVNFNGKISKWETAHMAEYANYYGLAMCTVVIQMWPRHMIIFLCFITAQDQQANPQNNLKKYL